MKIISLIVLFVVISLTGLAQIPPEALNYSSVIRGNNGQALPNKNVAFKFSILKGSSTGEAVYIETHVKSTDQWGSISMPIGLGNPVLGIFSEIGWSLNTFYLKIELDDNGGSNFKLMGTLQFLSVPYSLHAKTAETVIDLKENDPLFSESVAKGITEADTIRWNSSIGPWKTLTLDPNLLGINYSDGKTGSYEFSNGQSTPGGVSVGLTVKNLKSEVNSWAFLNLEANSSLPHGNRTYLDFKNPFGNYSIELWDSTLFFLKRKGSGATSIYQYRSDVGHYFATEAGGYNLRLVVSDNGNVGVGNFGNRPKSKLQIKSGDVYLDTIGTGVIMKSPNGNCWRVTVDDIGNLIRTQITCP